MKPAERCRDREYSFAIDEVVVDRTKTKIDVKIALAEKYERLGRVAGSTPKKKKFAFEAARYRRQAAQMQREQQ